MTSRLAFAAAFSLGAALALPLAGCLPTAVIPNTKVADTKLNRHLVYDVCEVYRQALENRDAKLLLSLASPHYYEDSGTPKADDDYGYEGLKQVLYTRLSAVKAVRYNIEYRGIEVDSSGKRARIDIRYDASFQIATAMGDRWERKQNDKRLELERDGNRWLFVAGM